MCSGSEIAELRRANGRLEEKISLLQGELNHYKSLYENKDNV